MSGALVVRDVTKAYDGTVALDGVSLSVDPGEIFACIGPNGAGKTTLVRAMTGTTEPDDGVVTVLGVGPASVDRQSLGVLPQAFVPSQRLTPRELCRYYAGLYEEARPVEELLATVGVEDRADTHYESLSGGEQRRVCLAIALVNDPDVLFLDEPTTAIDPAGRRAVQGLIADLAGGGTTVFLTTHDMAEAERLADRVALLDGGRVVATGTPRELIDAHGGDTRLIVETAGVPDPDSLPDLTDHPALAGDEYRVETSDSSRVEGGEGEVRVYGIDPTEIGAVADAFADAGVDYTSLSWAEPTLEDVYLSLTGHGYDPRGTGSEAGGGIAGRTRQPAGSNAGTSSGRTDGGEDA